MKKLPIFSKWIIILAALAAMGWMMWAVNDRASGWKCPHRIIHSEFIAQQIPASKIINGRSIAGRNDAL